MIMLISGIVFQSGGEGSTAAALRPSNSKPIPSQSAIFSSYIHLLSIPMKNLKRSWSPVPRPYAQLQTRTGHPAERNALSWH